MINLPPVNTPSTTPAQPSGLKPTRRVVPSTAADKRESFATDRRRAWDRRSRRGGKKMVMDRRCGPERRRASIDLSV